MLTHESRHLTSVSTHGISTGENLKFRIPNGSEVAQMEEIGLVPLPDSNNNVLFSRDETTF